MSNATISNNRSITAEEIARHLHGRKSGAGYVAKCPAHEDRRPSSSLCDRDGRVLVHCHAGCSQADVIAAMRDRGLWPERARPATPAEAALLKRDTRDQAEARHWAHALTMLLESLLEALPPDTCARRGPTWLLKQLGESDGGAALVPLYRFWRGEVPRLTSGLVFSGARSDERIRRRLAGWILVESRRGL